MDTTLSELRYKARRYDELKLELPALRYKAQRYDEIKGELAALRVKAEHIFPKGWRQWRIFQLICAPMVLVIRRLSFADDRTIDNREPHSIEHEGLRDTEASGPASASRNRPKALDAASISQGPVCILARKQLRNVTRIPRMGKALAEGGHTVVVVSLRAPVQQLREMCRDVSYIEVSPRPYTGLVINAINRRILARRNRYKQRNAKYQLTIAKGGLHAFGPKLGRAVVVPLAATTEFVRRLIFITPCALLLRKSSQSLLQAWLELSHQDSLAIMARFIAVMQQWALTHAFAEAADKATKGLRFAVVQAHDNYALVAAARLAARDQAKVVYDAVEISSHRLALDLNIVERVRERLERRKELRIFRKAAAVVTVGDGLADWYSKRYRISRPLVVRNCRYYWPYEIDRRLRADAGIEPDERVLVWCGAAYPEQGIEFLISALPLMAPDIHLAIVATFLPRWASYVNEVLPAHAAALGVGGRVHLLAAREPNDLVPYISGADIGVIPRPSQHLNNFFSMPNKFLEMVMARLPIAVSRLGDMVDAVEKYGMGAVFDECNASHIAAVIEKMLDLETYARLKTNTMSAAGRMTWEEESIPYIEVIRSLMPRPRVRQSTDPQDAATAIGDVASEHGVGESADGPRTASGIPSVAERVSAVLPADESRMIDDYQNLQREVARLKTAYATVLEANKKLRYNRSALLKNSSFFAENPMVNRFLRFARHCYDRASEIKAEAYSAYGVQALLAADVVSAREGGRVYCDVIEVPSFGSRNVANSWHPTNLVLLDSAFAQFLQRADGLITVGWALAAELEKYGVPVSVIPNYRYREPLQQSARLREWCSIDLKDQIVLSISTMTSGFEGIIEALTLLPEAVHLATVGEFVPAAYEEKVRGVVSRLGLEERVHFFGRVAYGQLTEIASGADAGLIALDPTIVNHQVALPNRFFDYLAAGLPIVTPAIPDIARIVKQRNLGTVLDSIDAPGWAQGIATTLAEARMLSANVRAAAGELCWETVGDALHAAYDHAMSITFIGYSRLSQNNRTLRIMRTLLDRGVQVTLCCPDQEHPPVGLDRIKFVPTPLI